MEQREVMPLADMKVLMNHIYEYKKGVRQMVLYTFNEKYRDFAVNRLEKQSIDYIIQPVGNGRVNLFFGKRECMAAIRRMVTRPLCQLTPEEDFILGAMLGYDICAQCERYCERKQRCECASVSNWHPRHARIKALIINWLFAFIHTGRTPPRRMAQGAALGCGLLGPQVVLDDTTSPRQGNDFFLPAYPTASPRTIPLRPALVSKQKSFLK